MSELSPDEPKANRVGGRVSEARRAAGLTQTELADKVGLGLWHIQLLETYAGSVPLAKLSEIASVTGRPLSWFTGDTADDPEPAPGRDGPEAELEPDLTRRLRELVGELAGEPASGPAGRPGDRPPLPLDDLFERARSALSSR